MTSITIIKNAVERNHALSKRGFGAIPVDFELEGDINAGNAAFYYLLEKEGYTDEVVNREMDLTYSDIRKVKKYSDNGILDKNGDGRFLNKLSLCENFIKFQ